MSSALRQPPLPEDGTGWGGMGGRRDGGGCLTLHKTGATAWPRDLWLLPPPSPRSHPHAADWPSGYECRPSSKSSRHPGAAGAAGAAASEPRGQTHLTASRGGTQRGLGAGLREAGGPAQTPHPSPRLPLPHTAEGPHLHTGSDPSRHLSASRGPQRLLPGGHSLRKAPRVCRQPLPALESGLPVQRPWGFARPKWVLRPT